MTDHLPECCYRSTQPMSICICSELRACERRVRERTIVSYDMTRAEHAEQQGYADALSAARDAVAAVPHGISVGTGLHIHRDRALAAIDALRGEQA